MTTDDDFSILKNQMSEFNGEVCALETCLEELKPASPNLKGDIENCKKALGLTQHTNVLLQQNTTKLELAVSLLQSYFQATKSLIGSLSKLEKGDSTNQGLCTKVINSRNKLEQALTTILKQLNLTDTSADNSFPARDFCTTSSTTPPQDFINYMVSTEKVLKSLDRRGVSLPEREINQLIKNLGCAVKNLPPTSTNDAIAQSIQIHDLLEENYSFLSDLIRSGDLVSPGIL
jgi:hypothetical protein